MEVFFDKIKQIRKEQKLSSEEFCKKAGIGRSTLWTWEKGRQFPSERKIELIAECLNVSVNVISDLEPKAEKSKVKLSETVNSWLLLGSSNSQRKIIEHEEIIRKIRHQQSELLQASVVIKAIMSTIQSCFYIKDKNLKYIIANEKFLRNASLPYDYNVIGKDDNTFFPIKEAELNTIEDLKVLETGDSITEKEAVIPGTRRKRLGLISKMPLIDSLGKVAGVVGTFVDITDRKKLEVEKRQMEIHRMLESTFSTPSEILWLISYRPKREYLYISNSVEKMLGYSVDKFYSDEDFWIENCVYPDDRNFQKEILKTGNSPEKMEYRLINSKQEILWVEEFTFKQIYKGKECIGFITRDISARKKHEKYIINQTKNNIIASIKDFVDDRNLIDKIKNM